ncbi:aldo/keto reductase [Candidatus Berkelbacteria bacterium]|nr:aldo/keto reductase [Candidatus Berkelbacteria bacterium]
MDIPTKRLSNGFEIPVYGLGTWAMGGKWEADPSRDEQDLAGIRAALVRGVRHIDTAESYAAGHAEELVGQVLRDAPRQDVLLVTTKFSPGHARYGDVLQACEASLRRLGTDYLDLYLLHAPSSVPITETMQAMNELVRRKLVRWIGVSNFGVDRLREAQAVSEQPIVVNQVYYNLGSREAETSGLLSYCQQHDVILEAYRPLEKGLLASQGNPLIEELVAKYHKTPAQLALNWLITQPNVVTIVKTSSPDHLDENLGALGWELKADDVERLRTDFPHEVTSDEFPLTTRSDDWE